MGINPNHQPFLQEDPYLYIERLYNHIRELEKRVEKCERDIDIMLLSNNT